MPRCDGIGDLLERFRNQRWTTLAEFTEDELIVISFGEYPELRERVAHSHSRDEVAGIIQRENVTSVVISTGLPTPRMRSVIKAPDTVEYFIAPDDSVVQVIRRQWTPGKFTAFIHQEWQDGRDYHGDHRIEQLDQLEELRQCRPGR